MTRDLDRLLRPQSIAVVGGGAWCRSVIQQCRKMGYSGQIWPVHPRETEIDGQMAYASIAALPAAPDACFVGVNRSATVEVVAMLSARGAGGAVCFASGFLEAAAEDDTGADLQNQLLLAAGDMPILGPNCYGFINYLDGALLWPDQHGGTGCDTGIAIVTQSSNIAINITMQTRGLPLAYVVTAGNQAQTGIAEIGAALLRDERVSVLGLHIEGFADLRAFESLTAQARNLGKAIVALKVGRSEEAQAATVSHTASLAGGDTGAQAFLDRLGILRATDLPGFLEVLKLLHVTGRLATSRIGSISCSGGEASLAADTASLQDVSFPPLTESQHSGLRAALGPRVALANPLDYHTYIWRDTEAMIQTFASLADPSLSVILVIVDFPRPDRCDPTDWDCAIEAVLGAQAQTGRQYAMVATLPELMPETIAQRLISAGVVPFCGLTEAVSACALASRPLPDPSPPVIMPHSGGETRLVPESEAKHLLAAHGLRVPQSRRAQCPSTARAVAADIGFPVVLKGEGLAHKTEAGAVVLNLMGGLAVREAADQMPSTEFLIEEMITGVVAELLIGVIRDPAHGYVLTLAAGGTLTEVLNDSTSVLLPTTPDMINLALSRLRIDKVLRGYRGKKSADRDAIIAAVQAVEAYVIAHLETVQEIEINPLLCLTQGAIAADALIREKEV